MHEVEKVIKISFNPPPTFDTKQCSQFHGLQDYLQTPLDMEIRTNPDAVVKKLLSYLAPVLKSLASQLQCDVSQFQDKNGDPKPMNSLTKKELSLSLIQWRMTRRETRAAGADSATKVYRVLNEKELSVLQSNITTLITPSWLTSLPPSLGAIQKVKLKADQWRVFGTVYLPLTLIGLWGINAGVDDRSQRCTAILHMSLRLIQAILIATSSSTDCDMSTIYRELILQYVEDIKAIFPEYSFRPNHHMAVHLSECIHEFGPVHSWWTFPFERLIGMIGRIPTNNIPGQMEATMALTFHLMSNLRNIFQSTTIPSTLTHASSIFDRIFAPRMGLTALTGVLQTNALFGHNKKDTKANLLDSEDDFAMQIDNETDLEAMAMDVDDEPDNLQERVNTSTTAELLHYTQLIEKCAGLVVPPSKIELFRTHNTKGIRYSSHSHHLGNSLVNIASNPNRPFVWARVEHFIRISQTDKVFVAVRPCRVFSRLEDPFKAFPLLRARLLVPASEVEPIELFPLNAIFSHFAALPMEVDSHKIWAALTLSREF